MKKQFWRPSEGPLTTTWFWPVVYVLGTIVVSLLLMQYRPDPHSAWAGRLWPGDHQGASTMLQVVATSIMTAATITSSLTVVALQLASQQYSPRLLREFARDRLIQGVLALLVATFAAALMALRAIAEPRPIPVALVFLVLVMGFASACGLLLFVGHIVKSLRVESMMAATHREAEAVIDRAYQPYGHARSLDAPEAPEAPRRADGRTVSAVRGGFVRNVDADELMKLADRTGTVLQLFCQPGDNVARGAPVAEIFGGSGHEWDAAELDTLVSRTLDIGFERTSDQDAALGLRRLTDIAVKAISPAINDPVTASNSVSHCTDLLIRLQGKHLGSRVVCGPEGELQVIMPGRDLHYFLDLVCGPIRRFGRGEPLVLKALLQLLRDCAAAARDDGQRRDIALQVELIVAELPDQLLDYDRDSVQTMADSVGRALSGDIASAYVDRAGETRST